MVETNADAYKFVVVALVVVLFVAKMLVELAVSSTTRLVAVALPVTRSEEYELVVEATLVMSVPSLATAKTVVPSVLFTTNGFVLAVPEVMVRAPPMVVVASPLTPDTARFVALTDAPEMEPPVQFESEIETRES